MYICSSTCIMYIYGNTIDGNNYLGFVGIFMSLLIFLLNKACIFWKKKFVLCFIALNCNEVLTVWQYATALS